MSGTTRCEISCQIQIKSKELATKWRQCFCDWHKLPISRRTFTLFHPVSEIREEIDKNYGFVTYKGAAFCWRSSLLLFVCLPICTRADTKENAIAVARRSAAAWENRRATVALSPRRADVVVYIVSRHIFICAIFSSKLIFTFLSVLGN